jgi:hypothetical protein
VSEKVAFKRPAQLQICGKHCAEVARDAKYSRLGSARTAVRKIAHESQS